jgi:hypothetical protein
VISFVRYLWPSPITLIGLFFACIIRISGGQWVKVNRAWEAHGGFAPRLLWLFNPRARIAAIVFGHVVLACDAAAAARLRSHEDTHVRQYERWGVFFPFAYALSSGIAWLYGYDPYYDNGFEREAFAAEAAEAAEAGVSASQASPSALKRTEGDIEKHQ